MKLIILILLFSFSAFGNYAKLSEVETNTISKVWMKKSKCGNDCIKIPLGYNSNYHVVIDQMVNDISSPINSKNDIEICTDKADCDAKNLIKICIDELEIVYMAADFTEIYCSKITGYNQIASGQKIVTEDAGMKAAHMAARQSIKNARIAKKTAIKALKDKLKLNQDLSMAELREVLKYLIKD